MLQMKALFRLEYTDPWVTVRMRYARMLHMFKLEYTYPWVTVRMRHARMLQMKEGVVVWPSGLSSYLCCGKRPV